MLIRAIHRNNTVKNREGNPRFFCYRKAIFVLKKYQTPEKGSYKNENKQKYCINIINTGVKINIISENFSVCRTPVYCDCTAGTAVRKKQTPAAV